MCLPRWEEPRLCPALCLTEPKRRLQIIVWAGVCVAIARGRHPLITKQYNAALEALHLLIRIALRRKWARGEMESGGKQYLNPLALRSR